MLKHSKFEIFKKDSIIFYSKKTEENVYIIVKGFLTVRDHSQNIEVPRTAFQMHEGDIINPGDKDNGLLKNFQFWFKCNTDVEVIAMSRASFEVTEVQIEPMVRSDQFRPRHYLHYFQEDGHFCQGFGLNHP